MNFFDIDLAILKFINQPFNNEINFFFIIVVFSVYAYLIYLFYYFYKTKQYGKLVQLLITSLVGIVFVNILKYSINKPRPYTVSSEIHTILRKTDPSFPSAHTTTAFLSSNFIPSFPSKIINAFLYFYLLFLIPFGSMYIGIHYPSDVLAGALIGFLLPRIISEKFSMKLANRFLK